jgi:hypothetical protein
LRDRSQASQHTQHEIRNTKHAIRDAFAIALLCALTLAFYRHIALSNRILAGVDAFTYFLPYRAHAAEAVRSGRIPLWNPYLFLGVPFLANPQAAVLYPLNLALCWLPAPKLVAWSIVLHVALAAVLAYRYARASLRLSARPAFLAASAFAFGGFVSGQVEHTNQLNVSAWFPLLLLLWDRRCKVLWSSLLALGAVFGLGLLAGHAQSSYISLLGLGVYALFPVLEDIWHALRERPVPAPWRAILGHLLRIVLQLGFVGLIGAALAAVQLLPTAELSSRSIRSGGLSYREAVSFSLKPLPRLLRYTFLPPWGSNLDAVFGGGFFTEYLAYVGLLPLLLTVLAVVWEIVRLLQRCRQTAKSLHEFTDSPVGAVSIPRGDASTLCTDIASTSLHESNESPVGAVSIPHDDPASTSPPPYAALLLLSGLGLFLALGLYNPLYWVLYKVVPGFALFRVPARWLFLYAFGTAMLSGLGLQRLSNWLSPTPTTLSTSPAAPPPCPPCLRGETSPPSLLSTLLLLLLITIALAELFIASQSLSFNHPTAPEAFSSLRTAPTHILAAQRRETAPGRFLSMSDILFDPGDLAEIQHIFRGQLSERALYDYLVAVKRKEIIAPNLPLAWQMYAVDGYDGGVLPLARYAHLQRLLLDEDQILSDGRLREGLVRVPPARLLAILGVRYVITDKVHDVWIDDVFYDLAFDATLGAGASPAIARDDLPRFIATGLGLVSYLEGGQAVRDGTPVAEVRLTAAQGNIETYTLRAGVDTAEGLYGADVAHAQARVGHRWSVESRRSFHAAQTETTAQGTDYVTRLRWATATQIDRIEVIALPFDGRIHLRGLTLVDERDGSNVPLILSTDGRYRQVHSGDVKIYELLDALPRAYVVHQARVIADDGAAIAAMVAPGHDPARTAILAAGKEIDIAPAQEPSVVVETYAPERIALRATLHAPGYLVLSDTWYPGWQATVDGEPATIARANVHLRAVYLPEGTHAVSFTYRPVSYQIGLAISALTVLGIAAFIGRFVWRARTH